MHIVIVVAIIAALIAYFPAAMKVFVLIFAMGVLAIFAFYGIGLASGAFHWIH